MDFSSLSNSNSSSQANPVQEQVWRILSSAAFSRAPRSRALFDYLVRYRICHPDRPIKEIIIGIELFGRDGASYRPDEDPIVRVQAGRLRERLNHYYAQEGRHDPVRITLPKGGYLPAIVRERLPEDAGVRVVLMPVTADAADRAASFAAGLDDELRHALHGDVAHLLVSGIRPRDGDGLTYVVQGSVRSDERAMRAQLALLCMPDGIVIWSAQADVGEDPSIERQSRLAQLCRTALRTRLQRAQ